MAVIALVVQVVAAIAQPSIARCPIHSYVNGVRPSGEYTCRAAPPPGDPPAERHGILIDDHATEIHGRVTCARGEIAFARDFRTVACRR